MSSHYSYGSILRQRVVMAGLTLGLVTIMTGLFIELTVTSKKSTIDNSVQKLIEPLNPLLDLKTVEKLENYPLVTKEAIRSAVLPKDVTGVGEVVPNEADTNGATTGQPFTVVQNPVEVAPVEPLPEPVPEPEADPSVPIDAILGQ